MPYADAPIPHPKIRLADFRTRVLDAFEKRLVTLGYARLRMTQVADDAQVSSQAIRNNFGGKWETARAMVMRKFDRFFQEVETSLRSDRSIHAAVNEAMARGLRCAERDPVISNTIEAASAVEQPNPVLVLISTDAAELIQRSAERLVRAFSDQWPDLETDDVKRAADVMVAAYHSKILCDPLSIEDSTRNIAEVVGGFLESRRFIARKLKVTEKQSGHRSAEDTGTWYSEQTDESGL